MEKDKKQNPRVFCAHHHVYPVEIIGEGDAKETVYHCCGCDDVVPDIKGKYLHPDLDHYYEERKMWTG
ncbi:MAG: hypothetical protein ABIA21_01875 [Candidatus Aenigmatarchaeota archaeon]